MQMKKTWPITILLMTLSFVFLVSAVSVRADSNETASNSEVLLSQSSITAGGTGGCVLTNSGNVKCWGKGQSGEVGDGTTLDRLTPVDIAGISSATISISRGRQHTCALASTGGVKCWGTNGNGQLGDGTTGDQLTPIEVSGLSNGVKAITAGTNFTCALLSTGGVKCWGENSSGQLGDGTTTNRRTPTDVIGLSNDVVAIAAADTDFDGFTCALLSTGGVKCWGVNSSGGLGDGTTTDRYSPTDVSGLSSGVTAISAGHRFACALLSTGGVKCWGDNTEKQLGDGTRTSRPTPTEVFGLSAGVIAIASGNKHSCALLSTGGVKCWGWGPSGGLGNGATGSSSAVDVSGLSSGVTAITSGDGFSCALLSTGGVKCWGFGGRLGDSTSLYRTTPVDVVGLSSGIGLLATTTTTPSTTTTLVSSNSGSVATTTVPAVVPSTNAPVTISDQVKTVALKKISLAAYRGSLVNPQGLLKRLQVKIVANARVIVEVKNSDKMICNGLNNLVIKRSGICRIAINQILKTGKIIRTNLTLQLSLKK